jgi:Protein of unknown function (DUF732)
MRLAIGGFATSLFAVVAIGIAPHAAASPDDDFLGALANGGVSFPAKATSQVIQGGHSVCQSWAKGADYKSTVAGVAGAMGGNSGVAGTFVRAATTSFCPKYVSELP